MAKPPGFAHHAKLAKAAHETGDHSAANHHIGKMFALNRKANKERDFFIPDGGYEPIPGPIPEPENTVPSGKRGHVAGNFAKLRGRPS